MSGITIIVVIICGIVFFINFPGSYIHRRLVGGKWVKVWYNRWNNGGYEVWEKDKPGFDWESVGGRVLEREG